MTPDFKVIAAGINITPQIRDRLLSLTVRDEAGFKSDQVEITLDDRDNAIELPSPGAPLAVFMGYKETFLVPMGIYTADEVVAKGPPDTLTIRGKAANLGGSLKEQKTRNRDEKTIEEIVSTIAGEHKLELKVADPHAYFFHKRNPKSGHRFSDQIVRKHKTAHLDQTDESDLNFLMRIAREHDALATVKGQTLLFIGKGEGKTASGQPMPPLPITKSGKLSWQATLATRSDFKSVEANWLGRRNRADRKGVRGRGLTRQEAAPHLRHQGGGKPRRQGRARQDQARGRHNQHDDAGQSPDHRREAKPRVRTH